MWEFNANHTEVGCASRYQECRQIGVYQGQPESPRSLNYLTFAALRFSQSPVTLVQAKCEQEMYLITPHFIVRKKKKSRYKNLKCLYKGYLASVCPEFPSFISYWHITLAPESSDNTRRFCFCQGVCLIMAQELSLNCWLELLRRRVF